MSPYGGLVGVCDVSWVVFRLQYHGGNLFAQLINVCVRSLRLIAPIIGTYETLTHLAACWNLSDSLYLMLWLFNVSPLNFLHRLLLTLLRDLVILLGLNLPQMHVSQGREGVGISSVVHDLPHINDYLCLINRVQIFSNYSSQHCHLTLPQRVDQWVIRAAKLGTLVLIIHQVTFAFQVWHLDRLLWKPLGWVLVR